MVTQLAREAGAYIIGTGRAADRQTALDFGAQEFVDLDNDALEDVGGRNTGNHRRPTPVTAGRRPGDRLRRRARPRPTQ
jgi:NADPH:quinone reductase-like Zn-dependent oxidoreductase